MTSETGGPRDGGGDLSAWVGRERRTSDLLTVERARKLSATLDGDPRLLESGAPLPPAWHWIYFHEPVTRTELAEDGHERRGAFLPPIPLPRRMWAGGRLRFRRPLRLGRRVVRRSVIRSIEEKEGRTGPLAFVTVAHRISDDDGVALEEEQDLVYLERRSSEHRATEESRGRGEAGSDRDGAGEEEAMPPADQEEHRLDFEADEVTLFRFSALTFNSHRIHYDHPWATEVEGYPDLVVHGPLLALVLVGAGARWAGLERPGGLDGWRFDYRARRPAFCRERLELRGRDDPARAGGMALRIVHAGRGTLMEAVLAPPVG